MAKEVKYYRFDVELTNGFKYSYTTLGRFLEADKIASSGYWTKSVVSEEITEVDHTAFWSVGLEDEPKTVRSVVRKQQSVVRKQQRIVEKKEPDIMPKFSSLEDFFGDDDERTRPSVPTKKTSRNKTTDSKPKVRSRKSA